MGKENVKKLVDQFWNYIPEDRKFKTINIKKGFSISIVKNNLSQIISGVTHTSKDRKKVSGKHKGEFDRNNLLNQLSYQINLKKLLKALEKTIINGGEGAEAVGCFLFGGVSSEIVTDDHGQGTKRDFKIDSMGVSNKVGKYAEAINLGRTPALDKLFRTMATNLTQSKIGTWSSYKKWLVKSDKILKASLSTEGIKFYSNLLKSRINKGLNITFWDNMTYKDLVTSVTYAYFWEAISFFHVPRDEDGNVKHIHLWIRKPLPEEYRTAKYYDWWLERALGSPKLPSFNDFSPKYSFFEVEEFTDVEDLESYFKFKDHPIPTPVEIIQYKREVANLKSRVEREENHKKLNAVTKKLTDDGHFTGDIKLC